ncbi:MAG: polysaccharide biosynthesis C-terminal domain-containing protein [Flavobacteriales bacterium]|nr:polysaccharide biosynthesis C-terminal domain-containing protein [Flavobacteriales bacterium]
MSVLRKLAGQTAIYGLSSIVARFLNFLLTPLYTSKGVFPPEEYGVITSLYAWAPFISIVLTFGMETAYFRFSQASPNTSLKGPDAERTYGTALLSVSLVSVVFALLGTLLAQPIAAGIGFPAFTSSVVMLVAILAFDALAAIPMARLRKEGRAWWFVFVNASNVVVNIALNVFFIGYCMRKFNAGESTPLIEAVYDPSLGVGYVFLANVASSAVKLLLLLPQWWPLRLRSGRAPLRFEKQLVRPMLAFAMPLLVAGFAGMINETADRIMLKKILDPMLGEQATNAQIGIYGACYKLAILITLFIQAFRMGAEPFFFSHAKEKNSKETFARIMNLFVAVCMAAFLCVMLFLDLFKWFIPNPDFHAGLRVVPILMLANVFLGIYYNQSVWYKLTNKTGAGGTIALIGASITLALLFILVPIMGYMGAAWTTLACYASMAVISYAWGQKHYPVPYNVSRVLGYMAGAVFLWWAVSTLEASTQPSAATSYALRLTSLCAYTYWAWTKEKKPLPSAAP